MMGDFTYGFETHNAIQQIVSNNIIKKNSVNDIGYGYIIGTIYYSYLAILGSWGILGRSNILGG